MKIVYINYLYDMEGCSVGAAVHVKELEKSLRACGHQVKVHYLNRFSNVDASVKSKTRGFFKKKLWRYLNQINCLFANRRYFFKEYKILSQERPDVVLVRYNFLNFSLALVARLKKIPFVLEVNAPMAYENRKFVNHPVQLPIIPEALEKLNLRLASKVVVVSQELKNYYLNWNIPAGKIAVVINGVDEKKFHPATISKTVLSDFRLEHKTVIGFIGSFHFWHGLENLMRFIDETLSEFSEVAFLLVGYGPLKDDLERRLKKEVEENRVIFSGHVPHNEIPEYLAAMDIVVAPYPDLDFFYYSPLKLFEYMAAGKPVIASRVGQIKEIITDNYDGLLVEADNIEHILEKSFQLIKDKALRKRLGENARKTIEQKYTWKHTANKISKLLGDAAK